MPKASHPALETTRLASLRRYDILDTPAEPELDEIVKLAASAIDSGMGGVSAR